MVPAVTSEAMKSFYKFWLMARIKD